jgi:thymidylate synthase
LFKISEILDTPIESLLDINPNSIYNQTNNDNSIGHQEIGQLYQDKKEKSEKIEQLYEARLKDKNEMVEQLQKIIEKLG